MHHSARPLLTPTQWLVLERVAALREELAAQRQALTAPRQRADAARYVLTLVAAITSQKYGEGTNVAQEGAHAPVGEAYGRRVVRLLAAV